MKMIVRKDATSKLIQVFVMDSSQTDGRGLTGLVFNSAGLTAYYYREGAGAPVQIALVTMTVGTWASGGFKEISAANMPGWYQVGLPDVVLATGADSVGVCLKGAADMAPVNAEIQLTEYELGNEASVVMRTDTVAEIATVPAKDAPLHSMIQWLFTLVRNKRITSEGLDTLRNDADGADVASATLTHTATTFTKGKYS